MVRSKFHIIIPVLLVPLFLGTALVLSFLPHKAAPKHWDIDQAAWGNSSWGACGDTAEKNCAADFLVLGPKGDKTARVELDTTWTAPGLRFVDHRANTAPETLGATPTADPCATIFSVEQPHLLVGALGRGCQPQTADPRSSFTLLIANEDDQPRVIEIQVYHQ